VLSFKKLQAEMVKLWTDEQYSPEFKCSPSSYKHFDHALKHVQKAAQELVNFVEEADHDGAIGTFPLEEVRKYLADIVISAARLANVAPEGEVDLEKAVIDRVHRKMGVLIVGDSLKRKKK
jgi:hypothetical protein